MKGKKLLIIGAGGHGRVVADIANKMRKWENIYFLDDNASVRMTLGYEVIGNTKDLNNYTEMYDIYDIFVGIGDNNLRRSYLEEINKLDEVIIPALIHPNSVVDGSVSIGAGSVIMAGVVINSSTHIGRGCIINTSATIDHDCFLEDFVHVSPGVNIGGSVKVGKGSWLGIGSAVINNVNIAPDCIIGSGAVVINDLAISGTYVGVPANSKLHNNNLMR